MLGIINHQENANQSQSELFPHLISVMTRRLETGRPSLLSLGMQTMVNIVENSIKHPPKLKNQTNVEIPHYGICLKEVKQLFGNDICNRSVTFMYFFLICFRS